MIKNTGFDVIIVGDINTSHKRIDHCDPDDSERLAGKVFETLIYNVASFLNLWFFLLLLSILL